MRALWAKLDRYWFGPSAHYELGVARALLGVWLLVTWFTRLEPRSLAAAARWPELAVPVGLMGTLQLPVPVPSSLLAVSRIAFPLLALLLVSGVGARATLLVITPLYLYLEGALNSWGYVSHSSMLPALELVVLCFSPSIGSFSLTRYLRRRRDATERLLTGVESVWPVRLMLLLTSLLYFSSGMSKLRQSGLRWLDGETLGFYLSGGSLRASGQLLQFFSDPQLSDSARFRDGFGLVDYAWVAEPGALGSWLSGVPWALSALSVLALTLELSFPLALCGRRWATAYLAAACAFHLCVNALMHIDFAAYFVVYALFIDWGAVFRWAGRTLGAASS